MENLHYTEHTQNSLKKWQFGKIDKALNRPAKYVAYFPFPLLT